MSESRKPSTQKPSTRRIAHAAVAAVAAGAITFGTVGESYAQFSFGLGRGMSIGRGGMVPSGRSTNMVRTEGMTMNRHPGGPKTVRHPGRDHPRHPGGPRRPGGPRIPGGIIPGIIAIPGGPIIPGGGGPGVMVVDDEAPQRRTQQKKNAQKKQPPQRNAQRGGFNPPPPGENRFVANEVLLNVGTLSATQFDALARRNRLTRLDLREFTLPERRLARVRINDGRPVGTVIRSLQREASLLGANPNYLYTLEQGAAAAQAALDQYAFAKMRVPQAHVLAKGDSIRVAVIDTTIDMRHPVLAGVVTENFDAMGALDKPHAHGTGIAGVIAAHGRLTGVAPSVKIIGIAAFGSLAAKGSSWNILNGIEKAATSGAQVVNMSFAGPADPEMHAKIVALRQRGAVIIAAAGNAGPNAKPLYPGAFPEVIAVTATDAEDKVFAQANRGTHIAVAAPGVAILAAAPEDSYRMQSGTSFAAAQVSGVVALLLERNRDLDAAAIRRLLMTSARDLGAPGHDAQFGSGIVDAFAALEQAAPRAADTSAAAATR